MPIELVRTPDGIGVTYAAPATLSWEAMLDADSRVRREIERNPEIRYLLIDTSEVVDLELDSAAVQVLAERTRATLAAMPAGIVAVVAPSPVVFGVARMWEMLSERPNLVVRVTRSRPEVLAWLKDELTKRGLPFGLSE